MSDALAIIEGDIYGVQANFESVSVDKSINFVREAEFALQAIMANEYTMKIAMSARQSVVNAVTNIAAIGISLNPAKKQAYLVPRDGRVCLDISYMGLLDLAIASGSIRWGQAELVHESDTFILNGVDKQPTHQRQPFKADRGPIVGVYVVVKTADGDYLTTTMAIDEVFAIRDRSSAWKAWVSKQKKCPWVTDEGEMVKKTVIKRAYKTWPKTDRLDTAVHYLNTEGGEGLEDIQQAANDAPAKKPSGASGKDVCREALMAMSPEAQEYLRELADDVDAIFRNPEAGIGPAYDRIEHDELDSDQKMGLWYHLKSDVRSALKREGDLRAKGKKPEQEAA